MSNENFLSVTQLNGYIRTMMEQDELLSGVALRAEISNLKYHSSGHLYFSLKDDGGTVAAVMFRGAAQSLRFRPRDGMKVLLWGRVSVYEKSGQYQVYVQTMLEDGVGDLHRAYEALRQKLMSEGLFEEARKKPLPSMPKRIGIVTSPTGAAIRDMLQVSGRRNPMVDVLIFPALVQGAEAAPSLCAGLAYFNAMKNVDLIIIGRGGGSIEDLWAFNDERVVRAVAASEIPVISAVGHETDVTLCDFAADRRAPTPSAAAEIAVRDMNDAKAYLGRTDERMRTAIQSRMAASERRVAALQKQLQLSSPENKLNRMGMQLMHAGERMERAMHHRYQVKENQLSTVSARLVGLNPLAVLQRGYSMTESEGRVVSSVDQLREGQAVRIRFRDGNADATVLHTEKTEWQ